MNGAFGAVTLDAELGRAPAGMEVVPRADRVVLDEIRRNDLGHRPWQSFAIRTPISSLGVRGDFHPYANVVAVRIVQSEGGMSGSCARVSYEALSDVSSRPSETIEWE
ncbi:MAG: hypothetical protein ABSF27_09465 [Candidatus Dormibacteria bacterium]